MFKFKKVFTCLLVSMSLATNTVYQTVQAVESCSSVGNKCIELKGEDIDKYVKDVALEWAEMIEPTKDISVGNTYKISVCDSNSMEYTVPYFLGQLPYGYAVVVFENNDAVVKEANLTPGQEGLFTELVDTAVDTADVSRSKLDISENLIEISPMQYAVSTKQKTSKGTKEKIYDNYGNTIESDELSYESTKYAYNTSIYIENKYWRASGRYEEISSIELDKFKNHRKLITEDLVERCTGKYCCVTQALIQIAFMEDLTGYSKSELKSIQDKLWKYCNIEKTKVKNNVVYGGGYLDDANNGFVKFAKEKGRSKTVAKSIEINPSVAWIKDKLKYNRPILMGYGINVNGKYSGHAISVLGYKRAKKVSSGNIWNYLMVYNSWDNTVSYINYSTVDFTDCEATYFWVK